MTRAAEVGEAEHGHARLLVEAPRLFGRHDGDLRQVFGGRLDVDRGVGQEVDVALLRDHHVHAGHPAQFGADVDHLQRRADGVGIVRGQAADQRVGIVEPHHHAAERGRVQDGLFGLGARDAFALPQAVELLGVLVEAREVVGIDNRRALEVEVQFLDGRADLRRVAQQDGQRDLFVQQDLAGAQDLAFLAFGEHDPLGLALRLVDHAAHDFVGLAQAAFELLAILLDVHRLLRDAGVHGGLRHRRRLPDQHARVERLRNNVLAAKLQAVDRVGAQHAVRHVFLGEGRQRAGWPPVSSRR